MKSENKIVWLTLENETGTSSYSQHAFVDDGNGLNRAVCNHRFHAMNESEMIDEFENIIPLDEGEKGNACKKCKRWIKVLKNKL